MQNSPKFTYIPVNIKVKDRNAMYNQGNTNNIAEIMK